MDASGKHPPIITLGQGQYVLLRRFDDGTTAIVWQAKRLENPDFSRSYRPDGSLLDFLRRVDSPGLVNDKRPGEMVAIKLPLNDTDLPTLRQEGQNLEDYGGASDYLLKLVENRMVDRDCPCLILTWAVGRKIKDLEQPLDEGEGLKAAYQLIWTLSELQSVYGKTLTDSLKDDSVFWDAQKKRVTIIDLGSVSGTSVVSSVALPMVGATLHRAMTGVTPGEFVRNGFKLYEDKVGGGSEENSRLAWENLSYGVRLLLWQLLFGKYQNLSSVRETIRKQEQLWLTTSDDLLAQVRQMASDELLNCFDLARLKGATLTVDSIQEYYQALAEVLSSPASEVPGLHEEAELLSLLSRAGQMLVDNNRYEEAQAILAKVVSLTTNKPTTNRASWYQEVDWLKDEVARVQVEVEENKREQDRQQEQLEKEWSDRKTEIEKMLVQGRYADAIKLVKDAEDMARQHKNTTWRETVDRWHEIIGHGQKTKTALTANDVVDWQEVVGSWQNLCQLRLDNGRDWAVTTAPTALSKKIVAWTQGAALLDRYDQALDGLDLLEKVDDNHNLLRSRQDWEQRREGYEQHIGQLEKDDPVSLINLLYEATKAGFEFQTVSDAETSSTLKSLRLTLVEKLANRSRFDEASYEAQRAVERLEKRQEGVNSDSVWVADSDRQALKIYIRRAREQAKKWAEEAGELRPGVLNYYRRQWDKGDKTEPRNNLYLLGIQRALSETGDHGEEYKRAIVERLLKTARDNREAQPPDIESALGWAGIAWVVSDNADEATRQELAAIRRVWLQEEERRLLRGLYAQFVRQQFEEALVKAKNQLAELTGSFHNKEKWLLLNFLAAQVDRYQQQLTDKQDVPVEKTSNPDAGKEEQDEFAGADKLRSEARELFLKRLQGLAKEAADCLAEAVKRVEPPAEFAALKRWYGGYKELWEHFQANDHLRFTMDHQANGDNSITPDANGGRGQGAGLSASETISGYLQQIERSLSIVETMDQLARSLTEVNQRQAEEHYGKLKEYSDKTAQSADLSQLESSSSYNQDLINWPLVWLDGYLTHLDTDLQDLHPSAVLKPASLALSLLDGTSQETDAYIMKTRKQIVEAVLAQEWRSAYEEAAGKDNRQNLYQALQGRIDWLLDNINPLLFYLYLGAGPTRQDESQAAGGTKDQPELHGEMKQFLEKGPAQPDVAALGRYANERLQHQFQQKTKLEANNDDLTPVIVSWAADFAYKQVKGRENKWEHVEWMYQLCSPPPNQVAQLDVWHRFVRYAWYLSDRNQLVEKRLESSNIIEGINQILTSNTLSWDIYQDPPEAGLPNENERKFSLYQYWLGGTASSAEEKLRILSSNGFKQQAIQIRDEVGGILETMSGNA